MIKEIIEKFSIKRKFPKTLYDEWFAYQAISKHEGKEELPMYYGKDNKYIEYKPGDIVPVRRIGSYLGFYKIVAIRRPYGDYASLESPYSNDHIA